MNPLDRLHALESFGIKFGLENITTLCAALGDPHRAYRTIIVAGTNGKGSVTAMVDRALRAAGLRVGRYTSPHLVHLEERFAIDGRDVSRGSLRDVVGHVFDAVDALQRTGALAVHPTFFEVTTAAAFELFRRARVDMAVLEVGLGGRFDATNVASPIAAAITAIDFDHQQYLGTTLEAIAFEKAGVIKPGMIVVLGPNPPAVRAVIEHACRTRGAELIAADEQIQLDSVIEGGHAVLTLRTPTRRYAGVRLALAGHHQIENALTAVRLLEALGELGIGIDEHAVTEGLGAVDWPGRLQELRWSDGRRLVLDAAHNPAGAEALAAHLERMGMTRLPIVFGASADKDTAQMLGRLTRLASPLIVTRAPSARAAAPEGLEEQARLSEGGVRVLLEPDPVRAVERGWEENQLVCATGSLFLVGDLLARLTLPD